MTIAVAIICAILGIAIGFLASRVAGAKRDTAAQQATIDMEKEVAVLRSQLEAENKKNAELKESSAKQLETAKDDAARQIAAIKADSTKALIAEKEDAAKVLAAEREANAKRLEGMKQDWERNHQKALDDQRERFDALSKSLVAEAKNATEEMLKQREKQISESGHATMEQLVNPLKETIAKMEKTMSDTTLKQTESVTSLKAALKQSIESNTATNQTANDLIRAFKHDTKIQGDWGECVLEELLASLGLQEGIHFETQATLRDANGNVLHDYNCAENPDQRKDLLKRHIQSLEQHVKELSVKKYEDYVKAPRETIDFVIMFVPRADALWTALAEKPSLWREAMEKNVYIADEQTLYAALRIVKLTWRQVEQAQNQQRVFELANEMLKRVGMFVKQMNVVGASLDKAQEAYKNGMAKFADKGQSVLTTCRQLESLGAKQDKSNPLPTEVDTIEMQEL